jgi:hypothetical protein
MITEQDTTPLYVYVCPYCRRQYPGPREHRVGGDGLATSCFHRRPGERGVVQPELVRIEVVPIEPFKPREIPADRKSTPMGPPE